jgi:hypothetical protein
MPLACFIIPKIALACLLAGDHAHAHTPSPLSKPLLLLIIFTHPLILICISIGVEEGQGEGEGGYRRVESGNWKTNFESREEAL